MWWRGNQTRNPGGAGRSIVFTVLCTHHTYTDTYILGPNTSPVGSSGHDTGNVDVTFLLGSSRSVGGKCPPGMEDSGSFSLHKGFFLGANDSTIGPSAASSIRAPTEKTGLLPSNHKDTTATNLYWGSFASCCSDFIETPGSVIVKLQELQGELDRFPVQSTTIYRYLQQQHEEHNANNEYLRNLQVLMLRSEQWAVSKAAGRFLRFLDAKLQWFGAKALGRPLFPTMTASRNTFDQRYLWSGIFQVLEACETKQGLPVLVLFPSLAETVMNLVDLVR